MLQTGYYLPDEQVVRQKFYVKLPPVEDLSSFGFHIYKQCRFYDTYQLVPSGAVNQGKLTCLSFTTCHLQDLSVDP